MDTLAIVNRIEECLKSSGMRKSTFYRLSGISSASLSQWRTGLYTPSEKKLMDAARCLGVSYEYLVRGDSTFSDSISLSPMAQKIAAAYDQATAKEKNIVEMILSAYLPAEEDRKAPVRFAAYSKDGTPVDFTGADPNAPIPHPFVKGDDIP